MSDVEQLPEILRDASPAQALEALADDSERLFIGVRHHSPACAAAMPVWLDAFQPTRLLLELPADFQRWLQWLGHPELEAPVALAGVSDDGADLSFYPFADFSPELAAVRWARAHDVAVEAIDLPLGQGPPRSAAHAPSESPERVVELMRRLSQLQDAADSEALWDQLVEARTVAGELAAVRRAALLYGWATRLDAFLSSGVPERDQLRERFMRERIAAASGERMAVVVGAFHVPALLDPPRMYVAPEAAPTNRSPKEPVTSLIAYSHELLDSRSGYPAGIRDPNWQQRVWQTLSARGDVSEVVPRCVVEVCAEIRRAGHVAGVPDSREATRVAIDLCRMRKLPAPGRRELLECIETCLGRGELLGRGRVVARALEHVLVGRKRGGLAPGTPRSGLLPHVQALLLELNLPGPDDGHADAKEMRLDPTRSWLDRRRHVAFERLLACGIPYASQQEGVAAGGIETLTQMWSVRWRPATEAMIELAGTRGVTLRQAAKGMLLSERRRLDEGEGLTPGAELALAESAAACGVPELVVESLTHLCGSFLEAASLPELLAALAFIDRVVAGHIPGLPMASATEEDWRLEPGELEPFAWPDVDRAALLTAAVRAVEGIVGSNELDDALALLELVQLLDRSGQTRDSARLRWLIGTIIADGSPLMQGAAGAIAAGREQSASHAFGTLVGSWIDGATTATASKDLSRRLRGALAVAAPLFEADPSFSHGLVSRVAALDHAAFVRRLPALRDGFEVLSPAARGRLLTALGDRLELTDADMQLDDDPRALAAFASADEHARAHLEAMWGGS